jgi:hypothetical protein
MELKYGLTLLTDIITSWVPSEDAIIVERRMLDGSLHRQNIGTALQQAEIEGVFTEANMILVNGLASAVAPLTLTKDGVDMLVTIRGTPAWIVLRPGPVASRRYRGSMTLVVQA